MYYCERSPTYYPTGDNPMRPALAGPDGVVQGGVAPWEPKKLVVVGLGVRLSFYQV